MSRAKRGFLQQQESDNIQVTETTFSGLGVPSRFWALSAENYAPPPRSRPRRSRCCSRAATRSPRPAPARRRPSCCRSCSGWRRGACRHPRVARAILAPTRELPFRSANGFRPMARTQPSSHRHSGRRRQVSGESLGRRCRYPDRDAGRLSTSSTSVTFASTGTSFLVSTRPTAYRHGLYPRCAAHRRRAAC